MSFAFSASKVLTVISLSVRLASLSQEERCFVSSLTTSKIACGSTISVFLLVRQLLSYAHYSFETGDIQGCASDVTHSVSGTVFIGCLVLVAETWLARRVDLQPLAQDAVILCSLSIIQVLCWHLVESQVDLRSFDDDASCSKKTLLAIQYARMIFVSLVIGCGFMRARFAWVLTVVWALSVFQELPPLHITTETYFDILTLPFVSWLLAAAFERSSRERWVRARTITRQLEEIRNVSSLRDIEQNRNRRLRERQRNQEQFLAAMSHELKTPLAGMIGMLRVAKLEHLSHKDPMHVNMCVTKALTCGQLLNSLVDDLLDRTRITTGKFCAVPTRIDLVEVVENVLGLASHLNRLNLKIDLKVDDSLRISTPQGVRTIMCYLDGDRIFQVLLNVVTNALKFTEEGGRIELSVKLHAASDGIADMPALEESSFLNKQRELNGRSTPVCYVEFKVKDTGVGIPANQIARCFQPFAKVELHETAATESGFSSVDTDDAHNADAPKQTEDGATVSEEDSDERKFTGSIGLGLHLCHEMVRIMGGVIDITSEVGKGTTVTITLPTRLAPHSFESFETTAMNPQLEATDDRPQTTLRAPAPAASRTAPPPSSSLPRAQAAISRGPSADEHVQNAPSETCGASLHPLRCLVVDDNLFNREVCAEYLSAMGHTAVIKAENGAEAVAMFTEAHERGEPFDVVLMDVMMPVMDGLSATQRIRELEKARAGGGSPAVVLATTACSQADEQEAGIRHGIDAYVTKPLSMKSLQDILAETVSSLQATEPPSRCVLPA